VPLPPVGVALELDVVVVVVVIDFAEVVVVRVDLAEVVDPAEVVVVVDTGLPDFGRYLMPVEEHEDDCPTGATGTKVPV
jgi:hypothetical protein